MNESCQFRIKVEDSITICPVFVHRLHRLKPTDEAMTSTDLND